MRRSPTGPPDVLGENAQHLLVGRECSVLGVRSYTPRDVKSSESHHRLIVLLVSWYFIHPFRYPHALLNAASELFPQPPLESPASRLFWHFTDQMACASIVCVFNTKSHGKVKEGKKGRETLYPSCPKFPTQLLYNLSNFSTIFRNKITWTTNS